MGCVFKVKNYYSALSQGETVMSLVLPNGPGIAIQIGRTRDRRQ